MAVDFAYTSTPTAGSAVAFYRDGASQVQVVHFPELTRESRELNLRRASSTVALAESVALGRSRRPVPPAAFARHGFHQMARLPSYRSRRVR